MASPTETAYSSTCLFSTGREPGIPVHTGQVWALGLPPKAVEQPQKILVRVASSTCTSRPMTVSYSIDLSSLSNLRILFTGVIKQLFCRLFTGVSSCQQLLFLKTVPHKLQANGQPPGAAAAGKADSGQSRQIG